MLSHNVYVCSLQTISSRHDMNLSKQLELLSEHLGLFVLLHTHSQTCTVSRVYPAHVCAKQEEWMKQDHRVMKVLTARGQR